MPCAHRPVSLRCAVLCGVQVGPEEHAICALSGGVDSTVAATLVHKVLGDRLHCVFVDNGLLRLDVSRAGGVWRVGEAQACRSAF